MDEFISAITGLKNMMNAERMIIAMAALDAIGSTRSIEINIGMRDGKVKEK